MPRKLLLQLLLLARGLYVRKPLSAGLALFLLLLIAALVRIEPTSSAPPNPEAIARAHLQQNWLRYGLRPQLDDLNLAQIKESPGAYHVRFQQAVGGTPVFGAFTTVNISKGSSGVSMVLNRYVSGVAPAATTAIVSQEQAIAIAREIVGVEKRSEEHTSEL